MTSETKIAANRRNAQRSTGPRTALGKARVRRNALQHGLAAVVVGDLGVATEVDRVAAAICGGPHADCLERERALIVAEAQILLKRIRRERTQIMDQMLAAAAAAAKGSAGIAAITQREACLGQLLRLERYERRALARRKRAVRLACRQN
jgi:hypothetical protein